MFYVFGGYCLDLQRYELRHAEAPFPLTPKVFQVLAYLVAHRDRVVLKQELLDHLGCVLPVGVEEHHDVEALLAAVLEGALVVGA